MPSLTVSNLTTRILNVLREPRRLAALGVTARNQWRGTDGADDFLFRWLDSVHQHKSPEMLAATQTLKAIVEANPLPSPSSNSPVALLFAFRGQWPMHVAHHYMVALSLAKQGFAPRFVLCGGGVERCGMTQTRLRFEVPPISCFSCRKSLSAFSDLVPGTVTLADRRRHDELAPRENTTRSQLPSDFESLLRPALIRHFQGDAQSTHWNAEVTIHARAGVRYLERASGLLDEFAPRAVVLFNGMFFPESLIADECRKRQVALLHVERGVLPNSLFLSGNEPACHYRSERLWQLLQNEISDAERERAVQFVESRRTRNIDPLGNDRGFQNDPAERYEKLASTPYVLFFAPVLHDTAAMGKEGPYGDALGALAALCDASARTGVRLIIRAHPDERKLPNPAIFTIADFLKQTNRFYSSSITLLDSTELWNPYRLAEGARLITTYNGTIGMECPVLGMPIANLGNSHYLRKGFTLEPSSAEDLDRLFLNGPSPLTHVARISAANYLAFYLYRTTIVTDGWMTEKPNGMSEAIDSSPDAAQQLSQVEDRVRQLLVEQGVVV